MELKIEFLIGDEKRFAGFISKLSDKDKIALVSHTDLDGLVSAKVVNKVIEANLLRFVNYTELNEEFISWLRENEVSKVIFTDVHLKDEKFIKEIEKFAEILIIDHHPPVSDYNSDKTIFINSQGYCAAYICYYLFSKTQNLEELDWLVAAASVADWMYEKSKEWVEEIYEKYGDKFVIVPGGPKEGRFWDEVIEPISGSLVYFRGDEKNVYDHIGKEFGDVGDLKKYADEVQEEIDSAVERFEKEKEDIKDGYFWEFKPRFEIGSIVSTSVSTCRAHKSIVIGKPGEKYYKLSARRQDKEKDMAALLKKLTEGFEDSGCGGHIPAAGGHILMKDAEEFKKRVKNL